MPRGAPAPKLAITIHPEVHARVLKAAAAEKLSVSAWLTAAARQALRRRDGLAAIADWEADNGAFSPNEMAEARAQIQREKATVRRRSA